MKDSKHYYRRLQESDKVRDRDSKLLINGAKVFATADLAKQTNLDATNFKVFKPSKAFRIYGALFLLFFWAVFLLGISTTTNVSATGALIVFSVIMFMSISILWQLFNDDSYNFTICIDREGIQIDNRIFVWTDMRETAIINYPMDSGKGIDYLVVIMNDNSYEKFDLTNFSIFHGIRRPLATYIEYFKPRT